MRLPRAERVTSVHRGFLAAQWPEVHQPGRAEVQPSAARPRPPGRARYPCLHEIAQPGATLGQKETSCQQPNLKPRSRKTLSCKLAFGEHRPATGLATVAGNDETNGA